MSYIVLSDRIKEISQTIGTGPFSLEGAAQGFSSFDSFYSDGDSVFYAITDGTNYEVGSGVFATGVENQISRSPLKSSNSNNVVDFGTGIKEVFVTYPGTHAVYHASGFAGIEPPQDGGIAFWLSSNVIGYDSSFVWDDQNNRIGINKVAPLYAIDIGGEAGESIVRSSGYIIGGSGIYFPQANDGDSGYDGGRQLVHFEKNQIGDSDTDTVIGISGQVNEYIYLKEQAKGFVLAGPPSGCGESCSPAVPQFRPLTLEDIPSLDSIYASDEQLVTVSGNLTYEMVSSGTQFLSDLATASGALKDDLLEVSGFLSSDMVASGTQFLSDLTGASGDLNNKIIQISGQYAASGTDFLDQLLEVSGNLNSDIIESGNSLLTTLYDVSGILNLDMIDSGNSLLSTLYDVSGILNSDMIDSGNQLLVELYEVSGNLNLDIINSGNELLSEMLDISGILYDNIIGSSGVFDRLSVDLTNTSNNAFIKNDDEGEPTHFRLQNSSGVGSRLLLESASLSGNTWANVSLNDGGYRVYNYTSDITTVASGINYSENAIFLDSGIAYNNFLPLNLSGIYISGSFLNNGSPVGALITSQVPNSGATLYVESGDITNSSPSFPAEVAILNVGRNGLTINKDNNIGLNLDPQSVTSSLDIRGDTIRIRNSGVVSSATDSGYKGEIRWDEGYIYVCVANNTWKRASLATWP